MTAEVTADAARPTHIVWDWNGTLLHDIDAVMAATNASFAELGFPAITLATYRDLYVVPVPKFYERLMGRLPTEAEWLLMDDTFHRHYWAEAHDAGLTEGALELLQDWQRDGLTQSLLSLAPHEKLVPLVRFHGIERHFLRVDGRTGPSHTSKAGHLVRHMAALEGAGVSAGRTVLIGDAVDDAVAAAHVGARAVLYTGGSHSRSSLESAGVPVVDTLAEAVRTARELAE
ncbi:HAD family hydrolase [Streptomyces antarcticus]|uniref:HAD family hydrolase n=1 Tax=Streptomyces antarcticus TaxID=2996458 RepID=UPI00226E4079|nr:MULTISPECIES: haloacid dehalogenase-like hydrolase [unclassified Streptomyces]MCY0947874.1 haloacid dehalogenase-like hydrolase [Streptomyces sp. H34-AA3]MCY0955108.1 haloacid dehalogenase-like hydrolase [Streptomyces sp. H27-S2]MCZ4088320.1 haloacid dehalogenase-like hydrolase [Streptomyces sp. H34-S5]